MKTCVTAPINMPSCTSGLPLMPWTMPPVRSISSGSVILIIMLRVGRLVLAEHAGYLAVICANALAVQRGQQLSGAGVHQRSIGHADAVGIERVLYIGIHVAVYAAVEVFGYRAQPQRLLYECAAQFAGGCRVSPSRIDTMSLLSISPSDTDSIPPVSTSHMACPSAP